MSALTNIIWIEQNINSEISENIKELSDLGFSKIKEVNSILEALTELKKIKFEDSIIIIELDLYIQFVKEFIKIIKDIFTIPIIIAFNRSNKKINFNNKDSNIINNSYYNYGGIKNTFKDVKNFILNQKNKDITSQKIDEGNFVFEYIDCKEKLILPL